METSGWAQALSQYGQGWRYDMPVDPNDGKCFQVSQYRLQNGPHVNQHTPASSLKVKLK